jgi:hypothetical protein
MFFPGSEGEGERETERGGDRESWRGKEGGMSRMSEGHRFNTRNTFYFRMLK